MKTDLTKPVRTRNGKKARIVCADFRNEYFPLIALVEQSDDVETVVHYTAEGKYLNSIGSDHGLDLINE